MFRKLAALGFVAALVTLSGCIDATTLVSVKKDGSGQIINTTYLSAQVSAMMAMGGAGGAGGAPASLVDMEQCREQAKKYGEGVTLVSAKEVAKKDGTKGVKAVFAFKDVTKISINPMGALEDMNMSMGQDVTATVGAEDEPSEAVTFDFAAGGTPKLTVKMPHPSAEDEAKLKELQEAEAEDADDDVAGMDGGAQFEAAAQAMMQQMFQGMRMRFYVAVDGEITKSDATYVEENKRTGKKSLVALMDVNFSELMKDPEKMKALQGMGPGSDPEKMKAALKDLPGVKAESKETVEISFK